MLAVLEASFRRWPYPEIDVPALDHLRWKMASHPRAAESHVVADAGGRIVALQVTVVLNVKFGEHSLPVAMGGDSSVLAEFREQRIFGELRAYRRGLLDGYACQLGFAGHAALHHLHRRETDRIPLANGPHIFVAPLRPLPTLGEGIRPGIAHFRQWLASRRSQRGGPKAERGWDLVEAPVIDGRFDELWAEARTVFAAAAERDSARLRWRFGDPRGGRFTILTAEEGGRLLGYAALRPSYGTGYIADLVALPGRDDVAAGLAQGAKQWFRARGLARAECWLPGVHPLRTALEGKGFVDTGRAPDYSFRPLGESRSLFAPIADPSAPVHFTLADTDLI